MPCDPLSLGWLKAVWPSCLAAPLPRTLERLSAYVDLVMHWNRRIRVVGPSLPQPFIEEHVADALWLASALATHLPSTGHDALAGRRGPSLIDVGTGAGLPGIPVSLVLPEVAVTLLENNQKRVAFLRTARRELGLSCEIVPEDAFTWVVQAGGTFDHAVTRATFGPEPWEQLGDRLVRVGGWVWWMVSEAQRNGLPFAPDVSHEYLLRRDLHRWVVGRRRGTVDPQPLSG